MNMDSENLRIKARGQLLSFIKECGIDNVAGKRILEIGFKNGYFLEECRQAGMDAVGTEISSKFCSEAQDRFPNLKLLLYNGGGVIDLPTASFDYIVSFQVLEHVEMTKGDTLWMFLKDVTRLLKPGGIMYHRCPNYRSFYEGHYGIFWLPFLTKKTGHFYLRLLGKNPKEFDDQVTIVTPGRLKKIFAEQGKIDILSLGEKEFVNNFTKEEIRMVSVKFVQMVLRAIFKLRIKNLILRIISWFGFHYPLVIIGRKKLDCASSRPVEQILR